MYNPDIESMSKEKLAELQLERLRETVKLCDEMVPFYRKKIREKGVTWKDIKALEDVRLLPFT